MDIFAITKLWFLIIGGLGIIVSLISLICDEDPLDAMTSVACIIGNVFGAILTLITIIVTIIILIIGIIFILPALFFEFIGSLFFRLFDK